jgi:hypothetical protein
LQWFDLIKERVSIVVNLQHWGLHFSA